MSGGGADTGSKGVQAAVVTGRGGCRMDADSGSGGGTDREGGGDGWDGDVDRLSRWEDNVSNITLGKEPNNPLSYSMGLEHHHPIMSKLGEPGG